MFWEKFLELCEKKKKSPNAVCADLNLSVATATKWKKGAEPRESTLKKIARYFDVEVEDLKSDFCKSNNFIVVIANEYKKTEKYITIKKGIYKETGRFDDYNEDEDEMIYEEDDEYPEIESSIAETYVNYLRERGIPVTYRTNDFIIDKISNTLTECLLTARNDKLTEEDLYGNKKGIKIPVIGNVAAGTPIFANENILDYEEITYEMSLKGKHFGLYVKGDSMEPKMTTGDVVIVRSQPTAETGDIAIVLIGNEEGTCKKIKKTPEGIMLISLNPAYEPMFYSNKQIEQLPITIVGKVVELRAKF